MIPKLNEQPIPKSVFARFKTIRESANPRDDSQKQVFNKFTRSENKGEVLLSWIDLERSQLQAYEYLCHVEEVTKWIQNILGLIINSSELGSQLQDGSVLMDLVIKLTNKPLKVVRRFNKNEKINFKYTDNINNFLEEAKNLGLPKTYMFEVLDLFKLNNLPKVIYSLHTFILLLSHRGLTKKTDNLVGELKFTQKILDETKDNLQLSNFQIPNLLKVKSDIFRAVEVGYAQQKTIKITNSKEHKKLDSSKKYKKISKSQIKLQHSNVGNSTVVYKDGFKTVVNLKNAELRDTKDDKPTNHIAKYTVRNKIPLQFIDKQSYVDYNDLPIKFETFKIERAGKSIRSKNSGSGVLLNNKIGQKLSSSDFHSNLLPNESEVKKENTIQNDYSEIKLETNIDPNKVLKEYTSIENLLEVSSSSNIKEIKTIDQNTNMLKGSSSLFVRENKKEESNSFLLNTPQYLTKSSLMNNINHNQSKHIEDTKEILDSYPKALEVGEMDYLIRIQSLLRKEMIKKRYSLIINELFEKEEEINDFLSIVRRHLSREKIIPMIIINRVESDMELEKTTFETNLKRIQALSRTSVTQLKWTTKLTDLNSNSLLLLDLQGLTRGFLVRLFYIDYFKNLLNSPQQDVPSNVLNSKSVEKVISFQTNYQNNTPKITARKIAPIPPTRSSSTKTNNNNDTKISIYRPQKELSLMALMEYISNYKIEAFSLIETSEKIKKNRLSVSELTKNKQDLETKIKEYDIKIGLLIKNRLDSNRVSSNSHSNIRRENSMAMSTRTTRSFKDRNNIANTIKDNNINSLNKESIMKLQNYGQIFYILKYNPNFLGSIIAQSNSTQKQNNLIESIINSLYGYNSSSLKLVLDMFESILKTELESCLNIDDFIRSKSVFVDYSVHFFLNLNASNLSIVNNILHPIIDEIVSQKNDSEINLETDPIRIYEFIISKNESEFGKQSSISNKNITYEDALNDQQTKAILIRNLQLIKSITDKIFEKIESNIKHIPEGIRYLTKKLKQYLELKFNDKEQGYKIVGYYFYYKYLSPIIMHPDNYKNIQLELKHRLCLGQITKMINQISLGLKFDNDDLFLQPLNNYVMMKHSKFEDLLSKIIEEDTNEVQNNYFHLADSNEIYVSPVQLFKIHSMLLNTIGNIDSNENNYKKPKNSKEAVIISILIEILNNLPPPNDPNNRSTYSLNLNNEVGNEIESLMLLELVCPNFENSDENDLMIYYSGSKLINKNPNKTCEVIQFLVYLLVIDINTIKNTKEETDIFKLNCTLSEFEDFLSLMDQNGYSTHKGLSPILSSLNNNLSVQSALQLLNIEAMNNKEIIELVYEYIQNSAKEFSNLKETLDIMKDRILFNTKRLDDYEQYYEKCKQILFKPNLKISSMENIKGLFSSQKSKISEDNSKIISIKGSAMYNKGILVSVNGYTPQQLSNIKIIIQMISQLTNNSEANNESQEMANKSLTNHYESSSNVAFNIKVKILNVQLEQNVLYDELINAKYLNLKTLKLFQDEVTLNVNLMIHFINKSFFEN